MLIGVELGCTFFELHYLLSNELPIVRQCSRDDQHYLFNACHNARHEFRSQINVTRDKIHQVGTAPLPHLRVLNTWNHKDPLPYWQDGVYVVLRTVKASPPKKLAAKWKYFCTKKLFSTLLLPLPHHLGTVTNKVFSHFLQKHDQQNEERVSQKGPQNVGTKYFKRLNAWPASKWDRTLMIIYFWLGHLGDGCIQWVVVGVGCYSGYAFFTIITCSLLNFCVFKQLKVNKIANDWMWTGDFWCQKQLQYQLQLNRWPKRSLI